MHFSVQDGGALRIIMLFCYILCVQPVGFGDELKQTCVPSARYLTSSTVLKTTNLALFKWSNMTN